MGNKIRRQGFLYMRFAVIPFVTSPHVCAPTNECLFTGHKAPKDYAYSLLLFVQ